MKNIVFTIIKLSIFLSLFLFSNQTLYAQPPYELKLQILYQKYLDNYQSNEPEKLKAATEAAKQYIKECESRMCNLDELEYFKDAIPALEKQIKLKSAVSSQENQCIPSISLSEILRQFRFTSRKVKSVEQINDELISEIVKRKVIFAPSENDRKSLKDAGANELLLKAIDENFPEENKIKYDLYTRYSVNYQSINRELVKEALEIAKEYVRRFEKDACEKAQIAYFKEAIPIIEAQLEPYKPHPINPKNEFKWKILKELEDEFNSKKWNEVFALGKKVYELDPEFVPLFLDLASLGFEQAKINGNKSKYNDETVFYAELAVKLMENPAREFSIYSGLGYSYRTKAEALDRMKEILDFMKKQNLYKTTTELVK